MLFTFSELSSMKQWRPSFFFLFNPLAPNPLTEPAAKQREHTVLTLEQSFSSVEARSPSHPGWLHSEAWTHRGSRNGGCGVSQKQWSSLTQARAVKLPTFSHRFWTLGLWPPQKESRVLYTIYPYISFSNWNTFRGHFNNTTRQLCGEISVSQVR